MTVRITDNHPKIQNDTSQKASIFLRQVADKIVTISTPNTPMKTGELRRGVLKQVLGLKGTIKWQKDYAVYQEDKQHKNYTTPGTGPHFALNAVTEAVKDTGIIANRSGLI